RDVLAARERDLVPVRRRRVGARAVSPRHVLRPLHRARPGGYARAQPRGGRARGAALARERARARALVSGRRLTRRGLLAAAGAGGAAVALGGVEVERLATGGGDDDGARPIPFHGANQGGIVTPAQDRLHFAAFDVTSDRR